MAYNPANPRGATTRTDEQGSYTAFHKVCHNCQIELTSRNRCASGSLRCMVCSATQWRERQREAYVYQPRVPKADRPPVEPRKPRREQKPDSTSATANEGQSVHHAVNPERQAVHSLLTKFLLYPTHKEMKDDLLNALVTYELKDRFRFL